MARLLEKCMKPAAELVKEYAAEIRKCWSLAEGKLLHSRIVASGHIGKTYLCNLLVHMYGKCRSAEDAKAVFDRMCNRNVYSWSLMIAAYAQNGHMQEALGTFKTMDLEGFEPNECSLLCIFGVCSKSGRLREGREIHKSLFSCGYGVSVATALLDMYTKCGSVVDARMVFDETPVRDVIMWTAMVMGYARHAHGKEALHLFRRMDQEGLEIDKYVFGGVLTACAATRNLSEGKALHVRGVACGLESDVVFATGLCNMYTKCGSLEDARKVFSRMVSKDLVSWNSMLVAYAQTGHNREVLELYKEMVSVSPDACTYVVVIGACSELRKAEELRRVHARVSADGLDTDNVVVTALIDGYSKCGSLSDAESVFYKVQHSSPVLWNAMMTAYAQHGHNPEVLRLLHRMDMEGTKASEATFASVLSACTLLGSVKQGRQVHARIVAEGFLDFDSEIQSGILSTALVNMYAKFGRLGEASEIFENMHSRDTVAWNAMIGAYAQHGDGYALELFWRMNLEGGFVDGTTMNIVLHACAHSGDVSRSKEYYSWMGYDYGVIRTLEHCACVVDGLGRAGRLGEAEELARLVGGESADTVLWTALLGACKLQGSAEQAQEVAKEVMESSADDGASAYVLVSNVFTVS